MTTIATPNLLKGSAGDATGASDAGQSANALGGVDVAECPDGLNDRDGRQWDRGRSTLRYRFDLIGARRGFRVIVAMLIAAAVSSSTTASAQARRTLAAATSDLTNPVVRENLHPGTRAWAMAHAPAPEIEGYASEVSLVPGGQLHLHVSMRPAGRYRVEVYRLGWYGGAGGRLLACSPSCTTDRPGLPRAVPAPDPRTGEVDAGWPTTDVIAVGPSWISGYYLAKLVLMTGPDSGSAATVPFIVRQPDRQSAILVQASVNTWEAYNSWGGQSLYGFNSVGQRAATEVSFNRPYGGNSQTPLLWEYSLVRYLERMGYDVTYTTDVDSDANPSEFTGHALIIDSGHDEYWSQATYDRFRDALTHGTNLAFVGADIGSWRIRYADNHRSIIEYRSPTLDPDQTAGETTGHFRDFGEPECTLRGVEFTKGEQSGTDSPRDYRVNNAALSDPWFVGTGFSSGDVLRGAVGYEWDTPIAGCHDDQTVFFRYVGPPANGAAVRWSAPSGAQVFSAGTMQFSWDLDGWTTSKDADPRLQRFFQNVLSSLTNAWPPNGPAVCTARVLSGRMRCPE